MKSAAIAWFLAILFLLSAATALADNAAMPPVQSEQSGHPETLTDAFGAEGAKEIIDSYGAPHEGYVDMTQQSGAGLTEKVTYLYWFVEGARLLPVGTQLEIFDIATSVYARFIVVGVGNHADIVPASAEDVRYLEESRIASSRMHRPVLVAIDGHEQQYAASLFPGGDDDTKHVDYFDGVMCLYFSGSTQKDADEVNPDDEAAIVEAYEFSLR